MRLGDGSGNIMQRHLVYPEDAQDVLPMTADITIMKAVQSPSAHDPFAGPVLPHNVLATHVDLAAFKTVIMDLSRRRSVLCVCMKGLVTGTSHPVVVWRCCNADGWLHVTSVSVSFAGSYCTPFPFPGSRHLWAQTAR